MNKKIVYTYPNLDAMLFEFGDPLWLFAGRRIIHKNGKPYKEYLSAIVSAPNREIAIEICKNSGYGIVTVEKLGEVIQILDSQPNVAYDVEELPDTADPKAQVVL